MSGYGFVLRLYSKMSCIQQHNFRLRHIPFKGFGTGLDEARIILSPNRQQSGLIFPQILLERRVKCHIRPVIEN